MKQLASFAAVLVVASASAVCSVVACGGSASNGGVQGAPVQSDAGPAADADYHDVYPAPHAPLPEMQYFGGRVIAAPQIVTVTLQGMDTTVRDFMRDFDAKVTSTPWWHTVMDGYGVGDGASGGDYELPDTLSGTNTTDNQVAALIANAITGGALPFPNDATIYVLFAPHNAIIEQDPSTQSCSAFGGYHHGGIVPSEAGVQKFLYAIVDDCVGAGGTPAQVENWLTYVASHEIAEAATDPDVDSNDNGGWYMPAGLNDAWVTDRAGGENADLCNGQGWTEGAWSVTKVWNPKAAKANKAPCQPQSTPWYFAAVPETVSPFAATGAGPKADGYVVGVSGDSVDVTIDVFSTEALPSPLRIFAGNFPAPVSGTPYDPTRVTRIYPGVDAQLSQDTAVNGDRVTLTITIDPSVHGVVKSFRVRAVLTNDDYRTWPVLLYIP